MIHRIVRLLRGLGIVSMALAAIPCLNAQTIHGTVRDSATREPIPGAVLLFMDARSEAVARALSDERGSYRVPALPEMQRIRVVRIGFRPRDLTLPSDISGDVTIDVAMSPIPTLLEPVHVSSGASCSRRDDRLAALSLLEQARSALLGSVVALDAKPVADMMRLRFTSFIDSTTGSVDSMRVHTDSSADQRSGFEAARSAADFVKLGFVSDEKGISTFHGPDAETLLDDQFRDGYCFQLRDHDAARPNQVGLGFVAAKTQKGRIDVDGTLWIDTVARELKEIRFDYTNLPPQFLQVHPGGSIHFRALANGVVLIDSWSFRLPSVTTKTTDTFYGRSIHTTIGVQMTGGAVATARWPDGFIWNAPLGTVQLQAEADSGVAIGRREVSLVGTNYKAVSDQNGVVAISRLLPGPYEAVIRDSTLAPLGISLHSSAKFSIASAETATIKLKVPSPAEYLASECASSTGGEPNPDQLFLVGRIVDSLGKPVSGATWHVSRNSAAGWLETARGTTQPDGLLLYCGGTVRMLSEAKIEASRSERDHTHVLVLRALSGVTPVLIKLP
ncbi:MAG TPA: carboxypeptidase-like regulatory domain-containing protein [Gemmatimonadaceae bacterium]